MARWVLTGLPAALIVGWVVLSIVEGEVTPGAWLGIFAMSLLIVGQIKAWRKEVRRAGRGER